MDADCPTHRRCTAGDEDCFEDPSCPANQTCDDVCWGECVPGAKEGQSCENRCGLRSEDDSCGCTYDCAWDGDCCADFAASCF